MWYVIQVMGGQEEDTAEMIRCRISSEYMTECFIPKKERVKKFKGQWRQVEELVFPGYVFAATEDPEEFYRQLKQITKMTKLLQDGSFYFIPLSEDEEYMIKTIGDNRHMIKLSKVRVGEGSNVVVLDGPLQSQEGNIIRVNLHKREVVVRLEFMGRQMDVKLGIDMVE